MDRWAIVLTREVLEQLTPEQLELGTHQADDQGRALLVFRDRFVGLRVASACGSALERLPAAGQLGAVTA